MSAPCLQCGTDCDPLDVVKDDIVIATGYLCDVCMALATEELKTLDAEFQALLDGGVSREAANAFMIKKIDNMVRRQ